MSGNKPIALASRRVALVRALGYACVLVLLVGVSCGGPAGGDGGTGSDTPPPRDDRPAWLRGEMPVAGYFYSVQADLRADPNRPIRRLLDSATLIAAQELRNGMIGLAQEIVAYAGQVVDEHEGARARIEEGDRPVDAATVIGSEIMRVLVDVALTRTERAEYWERVRTTARAAAAPGEGEGDAGGEGATVRPEHRERVVSVLCRLSKAALQDAINGVLRQWQLTASAGPPFLSDGRTQPGAPPQARGQAILRDNVE